MDTLRQARHLTAALIDAVVEVAVTSRSTQDFRKRDDDMAQASREQPCLGGTALSNFIDLLKLI